MEEQRIMNKPNSAGKADSTLRTGRPNQHQWSEKITKCKEREQSDDG